MFCINGDFITLEGEPVARILPTISASHRSDLEHWINSLPDKDAFYENEVELANAQTEIEELKSELRSVKGDF